MSKFIRSKLTGVLGIALLLPLGMSTHVNAATVI